MIRFKIKQTSILIHPFFLLPVILSLLFKSDTYTFVSLLALLLHETGHLFCASAFHLKVSEIEIGPFGGIISVDSTRITKAKQIILSLSGPLFSLLGYIFSYFMILNASPFTYLYLDFLRINLLLFLFNLLPVLPLDGGQLLLALFRKKQHVRRILAGTGMLTGVFLIVISFLFAFHGTLLLYPAFAGCFQIYLTARNNINSTSICIHKLMSNNSRLRNGNLVRINALAAAGNLQIYKLPALLPDGLTYIHVFDENNQHEIGIVSPALLCESMLQDPLMTLQDVVLKCPNIAKTNVL